MHRIFPLLITLAMLKPASALEPPDHEQWHAHVTGIATAIASDDIEALKMQTLGVFEQGIRMAEGDPRLQQTIVSFSNASSTLRGKVARAELTDFFREMHALTNVPQGLRSPLSLMPTDWLIGSFMADENYEAALTHLTQVEDRATKDLGETSESARGAKRREALVAAQSGDYDRALAAHTALGDIARRVFGPESPQYGDALTDIADVHIRNDAVAEAIAAADLAYAIMTRRLPTTPNSYTRLAYVFQTLGHYERALELKQRLEIRDVRMPGYAQSQSQLMMDLAYLSAMLGDGPATRRYIARSLVLAEEVATESPPILISALRNEARILNMAELHDEAVLRLERIEELLAGVEMDRRAARPDLAQGYISAHRYDVALRIGEQLLREAKANSLEYYTAARIVAHAGALSNPPRPRVDLAEAALTAAEARTPKARHYTEQYVLAVSYAAAGRAAEAVALHKEIIDEESATYGERIVSMQQWRQYAAALDRSGDASGARAANSRVERFVAALAPALNSQAAVTAAIDVSSPFGFRVELLDENWRRWTPDSMGWPMATFGGQHFDGNNVADATLIVVPFPLPNGLDVQTALDGLVKLVNGTRSALIPWTKDPLVGYEYRYSHSIVPGRPNDYVARFLVEESAVYLVVAVGGRTTEDGVQVAQAALDAVTLQTPQPLDELDATERVQYGTILANVANGIVTDRSEQALELLKIAHTYAPTPSVQRALVSAHYRLGHAEEVIEGVDAYTVNLETDPTVLLWRAFSYNELGNTDASIADFDRAFKAGARDEASVETYVDVLLEDERADDAALFVEQYTAAGSSPRVLALQALVYVRSGDAGKLAKTLVDLEDPQHSNAEAALVAAMIRSQTEGLAALTSLTSRLAAVGLASPDLYLLRAGIEVKQKMLTEAQASIDEGLKLSPNHPDLLAVDAALKKALGDDL